MPFGLAPTDVMFQRKIDELLQGLFNVFGIADNILIAGFGDLGRDHNGEGVKNMQAGQLEAKQTNTSSGAPASLFQRNHIMVWCEPRS